MTQPTIITNEQITMKYRHVLVPVDFSDPDLRTIETALEIASHHNARTTLMYVIEAIDDDDEDEDETTGIETFYAELEVRIRQQLMDLAERFQQVGLAVDTEILIGHRPCEIVRYSATGAVDLIVMYSQPIDVNRPSQRLATASHQVSVLCRCPVMLVK